MGTSKNLLRGHLLHLRASAQYLRRSLRFFEVPKCHHLPFYDLRRTAPAAYCLRHLIVLRKSFISSFSNDVVGNPEFSGSGQAPFLGLRFVKISQKIKKNSLSWNALIFSLQRIHFIAEEIFGGINRCTSSSSDDNTSGSIWFSSAPSAKNNPSLLRCSRNFPA